MVVSGRWIILVWIIAVLLLANSLVILVNIFDFPVSGMRHFISFISALGLLASLLFVIFSLLQLLNRSKRS
jgi:hypothetical protein